MTSCSVNALFKSFWDCRLMEFPEFATFVGEHAYDGRLQSYSLESIENRKVVVEKYLEEASELLLAPDLEGDDKVNLEYFVTELNIFLKGLKSKGYFFPLSYLDGVHIEFERLLDTMKQSSEADFLKILERLQQLPRQILEIIEVMKEGIKHKMTFHSTSVVGIPKQLDMLQETPEKSVFFKPFASISDTVIFTDNSKEEILNRAKKIIGENVLPAFKGLKDFLENEYFKHLRPNIAISTLESGKEYYQLCLDFHLTCNMTPEEVHQIGIKEVERIYKKMEKVIDALELKISPKEFSEQMKKEMDFNFRSVEALLDTYRAAIFNRIVPNLHKLFNYMPKSKLIIKPFPSSMENGPGAYYYAGTFDGSKPGTFYINTGDLSAAPKYDVMTLALHEAMPGHHLQSSFMIENENMPEFRRFLEDRRYTEAPALFPLHTAYVEGWGLYSEHLGYELEVYDDPYLEYGHLSYEMHRACRLVVDTGIHVFGWSKEQAVKYMLDHTALHEIEVRNEVDRYITWPGQACGYKIGELKIKALREEAEKALGTKFDVKEFHDVVLKSYGPLNLLEQNVREFIQKCNL